MLGLQKHQECLPSKQINQNTTDPICLPEIPKYLRLQWYFQTLLLIRSFKYFIKIMDLFTESDIRRKLLLQTNQQSQHTQFGELQRSLNQLLLQNRKKYERIIEAKPNFQYQLYRIPQNKGQSLNFGRELIMRQLDRLMEQENYLDRELSFISFQQQQSLGARELFIEAQINPFQVLRGIWSSKRESHSSSLQHVQSLNEIVGSIKLSVKRLSQIQKDFHAQPTSDCLKKLLEQEGKKIKCTRCEESQHSNQQLRERIRKMAEQITVLNDKQKVLEDEIGNKDEIIRKLKKTGLSTQTELKSKMMFLEQKLLMQNHQVKLLTKFKADLEKNTFINEEQKYQIYVKADQDINGYSPHLAVGLYDLLEIITNQEPRTSSCALRYEEESQEQQSEVRQNISTLDLVLPELTLPIGSSKDGYDKTSITERPKTDRKRAAFNQMGTQKLQDLEQIGKKYMRSNQLTTKRNHKAFGYSPMETGKNTNSTLKLSDSPKSIQQQK